MFKAATDKYSKFDEQGIPTHNAAGEELSKKQRQGVEKDFAKRTADFAKVMVILASQLAWLAISRWLFRGKEGA